MIFSLILTMVDRYHNTIFNLSHNKASTSYLNTQSPDVWSSMWNVDYSHFASTDATWLFEPFQGS